MWSNLEILDGADDSTGLPARTEIPVVPEDTPPVTVPISSLLPGDSPRLAGENPEHIRLLAAVQNLPPILVHRGTMRIIDGMHRLRAAQLRGDTTIAIRFFDGGDAEAFLLSVAANIKHGLPLSPADREAAARRILTLYRHWSDRAVAAATGLSPTTVSTIRRRLFRPGESGSTRVGRDGRVRPVDAAAGRRRASAFIAMNPDAPLRAIAKEAGVSLGTARDVRARLRAGRDPVPARQRGITETRESSVDGGAGPRRRGTNDVRHSVNWSSVRGDLIRDPAVRYAENGRAFVRWVDGHMIEPAELSQLINAVPPHWRKSVAELARSCARAWLAFARQLEDSD